MVITSTTIFWLLIIPVRNLLKFLIGVLHFRETLGKNLGKILIKRAKNMYDLVRSCQEFQKKS